MPLPALPHVTCLDDVTEGREGLEEVLLERVEGQIANDHARGGALGLVRQHQRANLVALQHVLVQPDKRTHVRTAQRTHAQRTAARMYAPEGWHRR
jgi:hypothetical protein